MFPIPVTVCYRIKGRPQRTRRMFECLGAQTFEGFELLAIGDNCPEYQKLLRSSWFDSWKNDFYRRKNYLFAMNCIREHMPDWGAKVTNIAIKIARGKYFMFIDNDDKILPCHVEHYYKSIAGTGYDFVANPTEVCVDPDNPWIRHPQWRYGGVGHGELIVNTKFLRQMQSHQPVYGQDWKLIEEMLQKGKGGIGQPPFPTYIVMSNPNKIETGYENDK
jgi:hypothetical protein